jgi:[ribosomal protein S18]-alanine N-acetyltransferase
VISLTPIAPDYAEAMAALHCAAFPPAERWDARALAELMAMPGTFGWIADHDAFILARIAADEAEILTLAVAPDRRRLGYGASLLAEALREAARLGARAMLLEVAEPNTAARALYAGFGFAEAGRRRRYYADGSDALILQRPL